MLLVIILAVVASRQCEIGAAPCRSVCPRGRASRPLGSVRFCIPARREHVAPRPRHLIITYIPISVVCLAILLVCTLLRPSESSMNPPRSRTQMNLSRSVMCR